jgi:DNA-directed RNA polymerase subunit omega
MVLAELVEQAMSKIEHPEVLINMVSMRVRQLGQGFRPLIPVNPRMTFLSVALTEIAEGKLTFESVDPVETTEEKPKARKRK